MLSKDAVVYLDSGDLLESGLIVRGDTERFMLSISHLNGELYDEMVESIRT